MKRFWTIVTTLLIVTVGVSTPYALIASVLQST